MRKKIFENFASLFIFLLSSLFSLYFIFIFLSLKIGLWFLLTYSMFAVILVFFFTKFGNIRRRFIQKLILFLFLFLLSGLITSITHKFIAWPACLLFLLIILVIYFPYFSNRRLRKVYKKISISQLEVLNIFIFAFIFYFIDFGNFCLSYKAVDFDAQNFMVWDFAAFKNLLPFRDVFYPYGLLRYLKDNNIFLRVIYTLATPLLFTGFFVELRLLFKNRFITCLSFLALLVFIHNILGASTFTFIRYGAVALFSGFIAYLLFSHNLLSKKTIFFIGILIGFAFPLVNDTAIYSVAILISFLIINPIIKDGRRKVLKKSYYFDFFQKIIYFLVGFLVGFFPFLIYFIFHNMTSDFFISMLRLLSMGAYAKTPFIPHATKKENLLLFGSLIVTVSILAFKILFKKNKQNLNTYFQLGLVFTSIFLHQRTILRPGGIEKQLSFLILILFFTIFQDLKTVLKKYKITELQLSIYYLALIFLFVYKGNLAPAIMSFPHAYLNKYSNNFPVELNKKINFADIESCLGSNFRIENLPLKENYLRIGERLREEPNFNGKMFSFPVDPIFYILFDQAPAPYFNVYDASPLYAQKANIKYIEEEKVDYIIYNLSFPEMDGVPNYIRGNLLFKYILNNFKIIDRVDNFLILKRNENGEDFFKNKLFDQATELKNHLLNVDLANIPRTEGIHKRKMAFSDKSKILISSESTIEINNYLKTNDITSTNKLLTLTLHRNAKNSDKNLFVQIETKDLLETTISFYKCEIKQPCIINFSNLPLFHKEKVLKNISLPPEFVGRIQLIETKTNNLLW